MVIICIYNLSRFDKIRMYLLIARKENFITKLIQEVKEREQQIFEGGETHGNKR